MRDLADPPDLAPEILWRSLLPLRPERPLPTRLRGAAHIPLLVRAVPAMAEALARDRAQFLPEHARDAGAAREVLALVLHTPTERVSPFLLRSLEEHEIGDLAREAFAILADIAPTYARSNAKRWLEVLTEGARHGSNIAEASSLAACIDATMGGPLPRPDRYWGGPWRELLDGHWMCFAAAREAMKKG